MRRRRCSECENLLEGKAPQAKTCSQACRTARSKRLRAVNHGPEPMPAHQKELTEIVRGERDDIAQRIVEEELRPAVRDAITQDVLNGIRDLVALTPEAVAAIGEDLASEDATIRQRAYALIMKYTLGNASVAPSEDKSGQQLVVNFELPRPDDPDPVLPPIDSEGSTELKPCDVCGTDKPLDQFVDGSDRCTDCFAAQRALVEEKFGAGS